MPSFGVLLTFRFLGLCWGDSDSADLSRGSGVCVSTCPQVMLLSREHALGTTDAGDGLDGLIACGWDAAPKHPFTDWWLRWACERRPLCPRAHPNQAYVVPMCPQHSSSWISTFESKIHTDKEAPSGLACLLVSRTQCMSNSKVFSSPHLQMHTVAHSLTIKVKKV